MERCGDHLSDPCPIRRTAQATPHLQAGASVEDLSLIHTCRLNDLNPFAYLTAVAIHAAVFGEQPAR